MKFVDEFKAFAIKGNAIDMAVGIVIGAAFGKIVASLVADVITPVLGLLIGGVNFTGLTVNVPGFIPGASGVAITYGKFIQAVFDFVIIAFSIFLVVKAINAAKKKEAAAPTLPPAPSKEEVLLAEIRDLLKK